MFAVGSGHDALGDFALEHERRLRQNGGHWLRKPLYQQRRPTL